MKKYLIWFSAAVMLIMCLAFSVSVYAEEPVDISEGTLSLSSDLYTYNSKEKTPVVTLKMVQTNPLTLEDEEITLIKDTDYTVSYSDNINAGTAKVTVNGIGNYTGELSKEFTINPLDMSSYHIKVKLKQKAFPGKAPNYDVYFDSTLLTEGTDYSLTATNYDKVGVKTAKVVITGKDNLSGTREYDLSVYPNKVTGFKTLSRTTDSVTVGWNSQENYGVSGYKVYTCDKNGKNLKFYAKVTTNSCTIKNADAGQYFYLIVKAYKSSDNTSVSSEASKVFLTCTKPSQVTLNSVVKTKDKTGLKVSWTSVACTGYEIEYTTDKNFKKGVKTVVIYKGKAHSKTISIPENDKVYYARVRAYRRYNNKKYTVYGNRSSKLSTSFSKLYASYTTQYVNNPDRTTNLKLACKAINGTIVYPGETFSFNQTVGKRTTAKGYKEAYVFTGPNSHTLGVGGGVCQVASTMFNAALKANFGIVERHQHSQRVTYCPLGRDAAIFWGSEDFKFKNTTKYPIKIVMKCGGGSLTCSYYVCYDVSHKKVDLSVSRSGNHFTLKRKVDGKVNYTAYSTY